MPDPISLVMSRLGDPVYISFPEHTFMCPFCPERVGSPDTKGHLYVNEEKGYFCHRCEARGRMAWLLKFLGVTESEMEGVAPETTDLRRDFVLQSIKSVGTVVDYSVQPVDLPENTDDVWNVPVVWEYAQGRGLNRFYCEYYNLLAWIDTRGDARLLFTDYVGDTLVYWTARRVDDKEYLKYEAAEGSEKSFCVWNLNRTKPDRPIYIAEGIISARSCGSNGVAIYGKYLSDAQTSLIANRAGPEGVCIVLDAPAKKNALAAADKFMRRGVPCRVVFLPGEETDPDDMPVESLQQILASCEPLGEFGLQRLKLEIT